MSDFLIRPADENDLAAIMRIEHASFGSTAWPEDMMRLELAPNPSRNYFVVTDQNVARHAMPAAEAALKRAGVPPRPSCAAPRTCFASATAPAAW